MPGAISDPIEPTTEPSPDSGEGWEGVGATRNAAVKTGGTVDEAIRCWTGIFARAPFEYITLIWHFAQQPRDLVLEELGLFMEKALPEPDVPDDAAAAEQRRATPSLPSPLKKGDG